MKKLKQVIKEAIDSYLNESYQNEIKQGINDVYEQNPELYEIGTKQQYSDYLDSIFPESKFKGIVYHATDAEFEHFDDSFLGRKDPGYYGRGFYFWTGASALDGARQLYFGYTNKIPTLKNIKMALLNIRNPMQIKPFDFSHTGKEFDENVDAAIVGSQVAVKSASQIHVLGTQKDIKNFKNYVS